MKNIQATYILPNFLTASSIFVGVLSIIASSQANFEKASIYLFIAMLLDGLDGRVARMTNTTSKFGVEFDSLADIVSFGVAPAMLLYFYTGHNFGKFGAMVSAMFVVFGAIRLARFNVTASNETSVFIGLPIPASALAIVVWVMFFDKYYLSEYSIIILFFAILIAILMVSNIRYPSFKKISLSRSNILKMLIIVVIASSTLYLLPIEGFLLVITNYIIFGIVRAVYHLASRKIWKKELESK
jgi:CDP-diacylglycerol---serine O-phosphatidyltransferase